MASWPREAPLALERIRGVSEGCKSEISNCKLEINYEKLRRLCTHFTSNEKINHEDFMKEYPSIFTVVKERPKPRARVRPHTCNVPIRVCCEDHNVRNHIIAIHGRNEREQERVDLEARLQSILEVANKRPIQRTSEDVRQLSQQLAHFSHLFPHNSTISKLHLFNGLAKRAIIESIPQKGYAIPDKGGLYILLSGCVEKLSYNKETREISLTLLRPGDGFGEIEVCRSDHFTTKHGYPMYGSSEPCMLLRITTADYHKVIANYMLGNREDKLKLINSCSLLHGVSPSILAHLAESVTWITMPSNTTVACEGQSIEEIYFIREGKCNVTVKVPGIEKEQQIFLGELGPGGCVGEVLLHSSQEVQPYTITTSTKTKLGRILYATIKASEVQKHILSDRRLTIPILTEEQIRNAYARIVMDHQWSKIKKYVMKEVVLERGINFSTEKYQQRKC